MATLDGVILGDIQNENQTKDSNLFIQPLPYSDSEDSLLMDLMGTGRTITLNVKFKGTTAELKTFIAAIEGIQDGAQTGSTYVGSLVTTSKTVLIQTFSWDYERGNVGVLNYNITLIEGTAL